MISTLGKMTQVTKIYVVLLFRIQISLVLVSAQEPDCKNCACCVNVTCEPNTVGGHVVQEYCTYGCVDGISGYRCYNKCHKDCLTCEPSNKDNCVSCIEGNFLRSKRCVRCPSGCKSCTSMIQCQECIAPYFNDGNIQNCSLSCPGNCLCPELGQCESCNNGYFNIFSNCTHTCPINCITCSDKNNCQSCKDGFYLEHGSEVRDCSLSCPSTCSKCSSPRNCSHCNTGWYGNKCQSKCSAGCDSGECNIRDGTCRCRDWYTGNYCNECIPEQYGENCNISCPGSCKDNKCDRTTGHCINCTSSNIVGDLCDRCMAGKWGSDCTLTCPMYCGDGGVCERFNGNCYSCQGKFYGDKCNECITGYYGSYCEQECPESCKDSRCEKANGTCLNCRSNFAGSVCNHCAAGWYGHECNLSCSSKNCFGNACDRDTGRCISCPAGFYGSLCEFSCSPNCINRSCDGDGSCLRCPSSYSGDKCCIENGHCQHCSSHTDCGVCNKGFYGEKCNKPCPNTCLIIDSASTCDKTSGKCLTCIDGFHGDMCNFKCSVLCLNNCCIKDNGRCAEGCVNGFEGPFCNQVTIEASRVIGISVGISSAATIVLAVFIFILLRRCGFVILIRKQRTMEKQTTESKTEASYMNTELQPVYSESAQSGVDVHISSVGEYERLDERKQGDITVYEQIQSAH